MGNNVLVIIFLISSIRASKPENQKLYELNYGNISLTLQTQIHIYSLCTQRKKYSTPYQQLKTAKSIICFLTKKIKN